MSFRRYRPDQEFEIYNCRVVLELQISMEVDLLMISMHFFLRKQGFSVNPEIRDVG